MHAGRTLAGALALGCLSLGTACADGGDVAGGTGGGGGGAASTSTGPGPSTVDGAGGHGCFSTETTCDGLCVDVMTHPDHCGTCNNACAAGPDEEGECVEGTCAFQCAAGFVGDGMGGCTNFLGAFEPAPAECAGCSVPNPLTTTCACPSGVAPLALPVQSDCPGVPMRFATSLNLCAGAAVAAESDFGGAYQVDDIDGWCGATAQCRVGNPMAGGACACPAGFDDQITLRSIIRLPCDNSEGGSVIRLCGKQSAPTTTFAGAYQLDDFAPQCRAPNPWTGDCSCPAGTVDRAYRVMVDGAMGLYGSTAHLCTPL